MKFCNAVESDRSMNALGSWNCNCSSLMDGWMDGAGK